MEFEDLTQVWFLLWCGGCVDIGVGLVFVLVFGGNSRLNDVSLLVF